MEKFMNYPNFIEKSLIWSFLWGKNLEIDLFQWENHSTTLGIGLYKLMSEMMNGVRDCVENFNHFTMEKLVFAIVCLLFEINVAIFIVFCCFWYDSEHRGHFFLLLCPKLNWHYDSWLVLPHHKNKTKSIEIEHAPNSKSRNSFKNCSLITTNGTQKKTDWGKQKLQSSGLTFQHWLHCFFCHG